MSATAPAAGAPIGAQPRNGLGVAALVCGIVGLVLAVIPFLFVVGLPLGILAIVFGGIGMRRAKRGEATNRGHAIAGLITGLIATVIAIIAIATISSAVDSLNNDLNNVDTSASPASFQRAQQRVDGQEHHLIHQATFITNQ